MKPLHYKTTKTIGKVKIEVSISLADDCNNGHCDFSATCMGWEKLKNGKYVESFGGCDHESILKYFPDFADFCELHLHNSLGQPMYAVENGMYLLKQDLRKGAEYLGISIELAQRLNTEDKAYFKYQLFGLGITTEWERKAKRAIEHLESLTGKTFEDYETPKVVTLNDDEIELVEKRIKSGYYSAESVKQRTEEEAREKRNTARNDLEKRLDNAVYEAERERDIMLAVFDLFGTTDNVIIYGHKNLITFNWHEPKYATYCKKWTEAEVLKFEEENEDLLEEHGLSVNRGYSYEM